MLCYAVLYYAVDLSVPARTSLCTAATPVLLERSACNHRTVTASPRTGEGGGVSAIPSSRTMSSPQIPLMSLLLLMIPLLLLLLLLLFVSAVDEWLLLVLTLIFWSLSSLPSGASSVGDKLSLLDIRRFSFL